MSRKGRNDALEFGSFVGMRLLQRRDIFETLVNRDATMLAL